jgi:hypothetical protein
MFYATPWVSATFVFYLVGEIFVLLGFVWIKKKSLNQIEKFFVNCARSKLEKRFQFRKNIEVTAAVLPLLIVQSCSGIFGMIVAIWTNIIFLDFDANIMAIELLCYFVVPILFFVSPLVLFFSEPKLRPKIKIGPEGNNATLNPAGATNEAEARLKILEVTWKKKFDQNLSRNSKGYELTIEICD